MEETIRRWYRQCFSSGDGLPDRHTFQVPNHSPAEQASVAALHKIALAGTEPVGLNTQDGVAVRRTSEHLVGNERPFPPAGYEGS